MKAIILVAFCLIIRLMPIFSQQYMPSLFLQTHITEGNQHVKACRTITAENEISLANGAVLYQAGESIQFLPGFNTHIANESYFEALIENDCENTLTETSQLATFIATETTLLAYPNPFSDDITIEYSITKGEKGRLQVYSLLGQLIWEQALENIAISSERQLLSLKTEAWATGMYILSFQQQNGDKKTIKVIKE